MLWPLASVPLSRLYPGSGNEPGSRSEQPEQPVGLNGGTESYEVASLTCAERVVLNHVAGGHRDSPEGLRKGLRGPTFIPE